MLTSGTLGHTAQWHQEKRKTMVHSIIKMCLVAQIEEVRFTELGWNFNVVLRMQCGCVMTVYVSEFQVKRVFLGYDQIILCFNANTYVCEVWQHMLELCNFPKVCLYLIRIVFFVLIFIAFYFFSIFIRWEVLEKIS